MNNFYLDNFRTQLQDELRTQIITAVRENVSNLPKIMHGIIIMNVANSFSEVYKNSYLDIKQIFKTGNQELNLTEDEYKLFIEKVISEVQNEFIYVPQAPESSHERDFFDY